ncbi:MAG: hypothetical protein ACRDAW_00845 [Metamycoplasmataceae bacterium]
MNKKSISILIGSLSIISIISPILVTVACSQSSSVDLKITANETQILTKTEDTDLRGSDFSKQLPVLQKLFSGVTSEKQKNFTFEISDKNVVTLIANPGFLFIGKPTLMAPEFMVETPPVDKNLIITAITKSTSLTEVEISILQGSNADNQWLVLQKLFEGNDFKKENLINFSITVDTSKNIVTLTGKNGYTINSQPSLNSTPYTIITNNVVLNIIAIATPKLLATDVTILEGTDTTKFLPVFQKLFMGINETNIKNITSKFDKSKSIVTLTANPGYVFNQASPTLVSNAFTIETTPTDINLNITTISSPKLLTIDVTALEGTDTTKHLQVLQKLFMGLNEINIKNITYKFDKSNNIVTLTANKGYVFDHHAITTLVSNPFTIETPPIDKNLNITKTPDPKLLNEDIAILQGTNNLLQLPVLKKLFTGTDLNVTNQVNFSFSIDTSTKIVTLTGKNGYTINGNNTLDSNIYTIVTNNVVLNITKVSNPKLLAGDISILEGTDTVKQFPVLKKLFTGPDLNITNQAHFAISSINIKNKIITLSANSGYVFDKSSPILDSNTYSLEVIPSKNLNISAITQPAILTTTEVSTLEGNDFNAMLPVLQKLFGGSDLNATNKDNLSVSIDTTNNIVTLTGQNGYLINNASSINSTKYNNAKLPLVIAKINQSVELTPTEVNVIEAQSIPENVDNQIAILSKLFTGISDRNFGKLNFSVNEKTNTVLLHANNGYFFGQVHEISGPIRLESTPYTIKLPDSKNLDIKAIAQSASLNASEVSILTGQNLPDQLIILKKLFTGIDLIKEFQPLFSITVDTAKNIITLTGKNGYTINSAASLNSTPYSLINSSLFITPINQQAILGTSEINLLNAPSTTGNYLQQIKVLDKLFKGINVKNFYNFTFSVNTVTKKVTLKANYGYFFVSRPSDNTGKPELESNRFLTCNPS